MGYKIDGPTHLATLAGERAEVETGRWLTAYLALLIHLQQKDENRYESTMVECYDWFRLFSFKNRCVKINHFGPRNCSAFSAIPPFYAREA